MEAAKSRHAQHFGEASGVANQSPAGTQGRPSGGVVADIWIHTSALGKAGERQDSVQRPAHCVDVTTLLDAKIWKRNTPCV